MMNLKKLHNNWRKGILLSACFVLALSVLPGCKKTSSKFGTEALNVDDLLAAGGVDTFQLKTYSILEDTLSTGNQIFGTVGALHDPKFGIVNASLYTQMTISGSIQIASPALVDSVVLSLNYGGYYGKLDPQTFEVYELADEVSKDGTYKRNSTKATTGANLVDAGSATQTPNTTNKVVISDGEGGNDTLNPQLRLKLDNAFGQQFLDDMVASGGTGTFASSDAFLSSGYFKGFKINVANTTPASGKGAVLYFNLGNAQTKMTIYYKLVSDPATPREVALIINSSCGDFNHVDVDHTGYHIADVLANPLNGQTQFYTQSFDSRAVIEFPTINNLSSKSVINNALLYLPVAYQTGNYYYPSVTLELGYKMDSGKIEAFRTASYDNNQKAFVLDLRDYIQDIVSGKAENRGLYLMQSSKYFSCTAERIVFNGPATPYKTKPKLVIKYTEFK